MSNGSVSSVGTNMTNGNAGTGTAMRGKMIGYWVTTVIVALVLFSGGFFQVMHQTGAVEGITRLGYPVSVVTILGVWKMLGGVALLAPRTPRLKEWAYAGAIFDLTGAALSQAAGRGRLRDRAHRVAARVGGARRCIMGAAAGEPHPRHAPSEAGQLTKHARRARRASPWGIASRSSSPSSRSRPAHRSRRSSPGRRMQVEPRAPRCA